MKKEMALKKVIDLVIQFTKTGNYSILREADRLAYENEIFLAEIEDGIAVEDDIFYFPSKVG